MLVMLFLPALPGNLPVGLPIGEQIGWGPDRAWAEAIPFPEPGNENTYGVDLKDIRLRFWAQYRVMYDASNIPSTGNLTAGDTTGYDFFRQRMRLGIDIRPQGADNVGGYMQIEYRGGFGGSSPGASDPRGTADGGPNAFNRLSARGVRYGYIWVQPVPDHTLVAGILPTIDQVGRVLWDGEWDFNVGGAFLGGKIGKSDYRLGFHRLISDLLAAGGRTTFGKDGDLWVTDFNTPVGGGPLTVGAHGYFLNVNKTGGAIGDTREQWWALTASSKAGDASWNGYAMLNTGRLGTGTTGVNHTGFSGKLEGSVPLGPASLSVMGIYATGAGRFDGGVAGNAGSQKNAQFTTVESIVGSNGYWGYTHIFNANGPSDTNDFGTTLNNSGAGLWTFQGQLGFPIVPRLSGTLEVGYFAAARERACTAAGCGAAGAARGTAKYMGTEVGGMLTYNMAKNLNLQFGAANVFMGDFMANTAGTATKENGIYEVFSRFQFAL
jgi:hypothetical protein